MKRSGKKKLVKKLYQRSNDGYAALSKRKTSKVIIEDKNLRKVSIKFTNKAIPRPVRVKEIHNQHQTDLVGMNKMSVIYKDKTYKNIFSLIDVFSRFTGYDLFKANIVVE